MVGQISRSQPNGQKTPQQSVPSEDILLRNYDLATAHRVWVTIKTEGECIFETSYRLSPGESRSIADVVQAGEYDIEVQIDNLNPQSSCCQISNDLTETIHIEMGNGAISITNSIY